MNWHQIHNHYPHQWLLLESIKARSVAGRRALDQLAVIDIFPNSTQALRNYSELHREAPSRELYIFHTSREELDVVERQWARVY